MALVILPCDCECSANVNPCDCKGGVELFAACRTRSGTATLCGFNEFADASTPPKKYRLKTYSGTVSYGSCYSASWSGSDQYNAATCALKEGQLCNGIPPTFPLCDWFVGFSVGSFYTETITSTTKSAAAGGSISGCGSGVGSKVETLSDEDTEDDAINRVGAEWSEWGTPAKADSPITCCAFRTARGAGQFTFSYQEAEVKIVASGKPGLSVTVEVTFSQRPLTGGAVEFGTAVFAIFIPFDGVGEQTVQVPNVSGAESCFAGVRIVSIE